MYDISPKRMRELTKEKEDKQIYNMMHSIKDYPGLADMSRKWIIETIKNAEKLGISAFHYEIQYPGNDKKSEYILLSTNSKSIQELRDNDYKNFSEWLEWNKHRSNGICLLDKVAIDITDINRENFFAKNSHVCRYIQDMHICKEAFLNAGFPIPDHVSKYIVTSIWELDQMRANPDVPSSLRERYNRTYQSAIADYAQMYATKYKDVLKELPCKGKHNVKESYFRDNHIPIVWDSVNDALWEYIQSQLKAGRYPEFIYNKAPFPYEKTKSLAKQFEKANKKVGASESQNFWTKDVANREFHICFPAVQQDIFYTLVNEFNTRTCEKIPLEEIKKRNTFEKPLQLIYVHLYDIPNWNSLCKANGVEWAIEDGSVTHNKIDYNSSLETIPVLYAWDDLDKVSAIVNRLQTEMRDYDPVSKITKQETDKRVVLAHYAYAKEIAAKEDKKKQGLDI